MSLLNANQLTFAARLAKQTGLDVGVVAAWVLAEEPASSSRAPNGANNWLNVGATDSGYYGAGNPAWTDPVKAADFTAQWLGGTAAPGFGTATPGIQAILKSAGQSQSQQVQAIQKSGWASSGYPSLPAVLHTIGADHPTLQALAHAWGDQAVQGGAIQDTVSGAADALTAGAKIAAKIWEAITTPATWLTVLKVIAGSIAIFLALKELLGVETPNLPAVVPV
jgi:hypothetical protein